MHIFTYGSLMFDEVWSRVVRDAYRSSPGRLKGYRRTAVIGEEYPVIYPTSSGDVVDGTLYFNVSDEDIARLDRFEGAYYLRLEEQILLAEERYVPAGVFVLREKYRFIASTSEWNPEYFRKTGINRFLTAYVGFDDTERKVSPASRQ